ncbi:hypothetical protein BDV30DRAFT_118215 [Aspergillus minisclerotigenes]|uniref:Uncharacterized protein n=1 Tax=Aspergillus minisclerotigenes TaxID=656917 RepID=A0A5N6J3M5_9EURO|nr:hypothetical protein BDV30DRAFT_118215 [Aspergillus minisclerotigenes]
MTLISFNSASYSLFFFFVWFLHFLFLVYINYDHSNHVPFIRVGSFLVLQLTGIILIYQPVISVPVPWSNERASVTPSAPLRRDEFSNQNSLISNSAIWKALRNTLPTDRLLYCTSVMSETQVYSYLHTDQAVQSQGMGSGIRCGYLKEDCLRDQSLPRFHSSEERVHSGFFISLFLFFSLS